MEKVKIDLDDDETKLLAAIARRRYVDMETAMRMALHHYAAAVFPSTDEAKAA